MRCDACDARFFRIMLRGGEPKTAIPSLGVKCEPERADGCGEWVASAATRKTRLEKGVRTLAVVRTGGYPARHRVSQQGHMRGREGYTGCTEGKSRLYLFLEGCCDFRPPVPCTVCVDQLGWLVTGG